MAKEKENEVGGREEEQKGVTEPLGTPPVGGFGRCGLVTCKETRRVLAMVLISSFVKGLFRCNILAFFPLGSMPLLRLYGGTLKRNIRETTYDFAKGDLTTGFHS